MSIQIENQVVEFVDLLNFDDYEILNDYPFTIRRKSNHYIVRDSLSQTTGYIRNALNGRYYPSFSHAKILFPIELYTIFPSN